MASIQKGKENTAMYASGELGPWFGGGDILIYSESNMDKKSFANLGMSYQLPHGYKPQSFRAKNLLAGPNKFLATEIEVFH